MLEPSNNRCSTSSSWKHGRFKTLKKISLLARNMAGSKSHLSCHSTEFHHGSIVRCLQLKYLDCNFAWRHLWNKSRSICPRSHHLQNFKSKIFSLKIWKMVFRIFLSSKALFIKAKQDPTAFVAQRLSACFTIKNHKSCGFESHSGLFYLINTQATQEGVT